MALIERLQGTHGRGHAPEASAFTPASASGRNGFFARLPDEGKPRGRVLAPLILLLAVLAAAAVGVHPSMAQLCGRSGDFPCGP